MEKFENLHDFIERYFGILTGVVRNLPEIGEYREKYSDLSTSELIEFAERQLENKYIREETKFVLEKLIDEEIVMGINLDCLLRSVRFGVYGHK